MIKSTTLIAFLTLGGFLLTSPAHASTELSGAERAAYLASLAELEKKSPGLTVDFRETRESRILAEPMVASGKLYFVAPMKFRREATGARPSTAVSDGKVLWIYYPRFSEAERYELGGDSPLDDALAAITSGLNFNGIEDRFRVKVFRDGDTHRLDLTPRTSSLRKVLRTLSLTLNKDLFVTRSDMTIPKGDRVTTDFTNASRGAIAGSRFEFSPPSGVKISEPLKGR